MLRSNSKSPGNDAVSPEEEKGRLQWEGFAEKGFKAAFPARHGINVKPSGRLPSERDRPWGSFVNGMPAEANARATGSFIAWCLADLPGARLQQTWNWVTGSMGQHSDQV